MSKQNTNIYKHSHFKADINGHGGCKRTAQIDQLLLAAQIPFINADFSLYTPKTKNIAYYFSGLFANRSLHGTIKGNYAIGRHIKQFENFVNAVKPIFFIWESTTDYNLLLGEILHKKQIPFVAIPHNIESLVNGSLSLFTNKKSPDWLAEEISRLRHADYVFTISREEQWLLSTHGIHSSYLPYHPTIELEESLLKVRSKRNESPISSNTSKQLLLLGTFYNKPTCAGYIDIINRLKNHSSIQINVAGFGSDQLKDLFNQHNIKIWGSLNKSNLDELLINSNFVLIHQEPTSGALTRIPELLIAGLPILANNIAARSYYDLDGIHIYNGINELLALIHSDALATPKIPQRPPEEKHFIDYILNNQFI